MAAMRLAALLFVATLAAVSAQAPVQVGDDVTGIFAIDFELENLNPGKMASDNTMWSLTASIVNFNTILGFEIGLYLNSFSNSGITITGFTDPNPPAISFVPTSTSFAGNLIVGGVLNSIAGNLAGPVFVVPNCDFNTTSTTLPDCDMIEPQPFLQLTFTTPMSTVADDILIGGDPILSNASPRFALSVVVEPNITEDTPAPGPTPMPTPTPAPLPLETPTPAPAPARSLSDPHMIGMQGQQYEFCGEAGKIYSFITDNEVGVVLNALFAAAYTSGVSTDEDTLEIHPFHSKGTWVTEVGVVVGDNRIGVSVKDDGIPCSSSGCLKHGSVVVNSQPLSNLGSVQVGDGVEVRLENSRSFSRVVLDSEVMHVKVDVVPPPLSWNIQAEDTEEYSHINLVIDRVVLHEAQGVLGETSELKFDEFGAPVLKSSGKNGEGILRYAADGYVVNDIFESL